MCRCGHSLNDHSVFTGRCATGCGCIGFRKAIKTYFYKGVSWKSLLMVVMITMGQ